MLQSLSMMFCDHASLSPSCWAFWSIFFHRPSAGVSGWGLVSKPKALVCHSLLQWASEQCAVRSRLLQFWGWARIQAMNYNGILPSHEHTQSLQLVSAILGLKFPLNPLHSHHILFLSCPSIGIQSSVVSQRTGLSTPLWEQPLPTKWTSTSFLIAKRTSGSHF